MLSIELQLVSNGRRLSLDDVADFVAERVVQRVALEMKDRLVQPQPSTVWSSEPRLVGIAEATKLLGVGRSTIWKLIAEKQIDTVHLGSRRMIRMETIQRILQDGLPANQPPGSVSKNRRSTNSVARSS